MAAVSAVFLPGLSCHVLLGCTLFICTVSLENKMMMMMMMIDRGELDDSVNDFSERNV